MNRDPKRSALALGAWLLVGAAWLGCDAVVPPPPDSNTNWLLACTTTSDCNGDAVCACGLCTRTCAIDDDCSNVDASARCLSTVAGPAAERCEARGTGGLPTVCVVQCESAGTCADSLLQCVDNLCEAPPPLADASLPDASVDAELDATTLDAAIPAGPVLQLSAGLDFNCVLLRTNEVKCWGRNQFGQLGQGDLLSRGDDLGELEAGLPPIDLGQTTQVLSLSTGNAHACVLFATGLIKCWGDNANGQLGLGDTNPRGDEPGELGASLPTVPLPDLAVQVSAGQDHTCALLADGRVTCWGGNSNGELGLDSTTRRGDMPNQLGANTLFVDLGGARARQVIASARSSCALMEDESLKCWGRNLTGQLGHGDAENRGDDPGEMAALPPTQLGDTSGGIVTLSSFGSHTCVLLGDGDVRCWGFGGLGQLALGDTLSIGDQPNEMGANLASARLGGGVSLLSAGAVHSCARLTDNSVKCWGQNNAGQLGVGDLLNRGDEATEVDGMLPALMLPSGVVTAVAAGGNHSCVLLDATDVICFGDNQYGQLGRGDTVSIGDDEQVIPGPGVVLQ